MKSFFLAFILYLIPFLSFGQSEKMSPEKYREDLQFFWNTIKEEYSYFDKKQTDWDKVKQLYEPQLNEVSNREQFVVLLEKMLYEIYDHHAILNTNNSTSFRLVPSGTDIWAEYIDGKPIITELRKGFGAQASGIVAGMEVIAINDIPINQLLENRLPRSLKKPDIEADNFVLRQLLAGDHKTARKFTLSYKGKQADFYPDQNGMQLEKITHTSLLETKLIDKTGYIKINDCLYDTDLVNDFDSAMLQMKNTSSLIIDLRETPSGGNSIVARAIMSWFISKDHFYQKHEYSAEERSNGVKRSWLEIVSPRKGKYYDKPLVILCDHWTASLGEAIVIGFEALKRPNTKIIGTEMARLSGAVYSFELPNSKIGFTFPAEKLYTVDGSPRENYVPGIRVNLSSFNGAASPFNDVFISRALDWLKNKR